MKIYHGSKIVLKKPKYKGSNPTNDYGASFYTTVNFEDACIWACRNNSSGFVNQYEVNMNGLKILDLTDKEKYSALNWVAILLKNRTLDHSFEMFHHNRIQKIIEKYYIDVDEYDVVVGYRADDAYFRFPRGFVVGNLSIELLEKVFKLGSLGIQYVFVSQKAIDKIKFIKSIIPDKKYVGQYFDQVKEATNLFDTLLKESIDEGTKIGDIIK